MNLKYYMPVQMYFGKDVVLKYKDEFRKAGESALIVTGRKSSRMNGSLVDVEQALSEVGVGYTLFDEVEENPSLETIEKAAALGREKSVDFVIGIGGGSPLDAAKAIALFIENPSVNKENIFSQGPLAHLPVIAVTTTAGTGSEVTPYSIVTVNAEKTKKNLGQQIYPKVAFLDSKYTYALPYDITVNTTIDAFTHLVEGYLNANSTYISDIYGEKGFELFSCCFKKLLNKELDEDFRDKAMLASALAGIEIAQNGTSLPHGMGYPLTYFKGLPHGLANGVLTIEYLKSFRNDERLKRMLTLLNLSSLDELQEIFSKLITIDIDITEEEIREYSEGFFGNKAKLKNHPEVLGIEDIENIYRNSLKLK